MPFSISFESHMPHDCIWLLSSAEWHAHRTVSSQPLQSWSVDSWAWNLRQGSDTQTCKRLQLFFQHWIVIPAHARLVSLCLATMGCVVKRNVLYWSQMLGETQDLQLCGCFGKCSLTADMCTLADCQSMPKMPQYIAVSNGSHLFLDGISSFAASRCHLWHT